MKDDLKGWQKAIWVLVLGALTAAELALLHHDAVQIKAQRAQEDQTIRAEEAELQKITERSNAMLREMQKAQSDSIAGMEHERTPKSVVAKRSYGIGGAQIGPGDIPATPYAPPKTEIK